MVIRYSVSLLALALFLGGIGCRREGSHGRQRDGRTTIRVEGSDTMVNLAQAWAEEYRKVHPEISIQVSGGGSGVGIASLTEGVTDLANSSREMEERELQRAREFSGKEPVEFVVAMDALAVYVHPNNPLDAISIEQLADIYGEGGATTQWSQLGVTVPGCDSGEIIRISRQNNSGTYHYFREAVLGKRRDYKLGSTDLSGSKDVVALVSSTPCAIGYSGMGYRTEHVKALPVATTDHVAGVAPSVASVKDGTYPISRPLWIYTLGEPQGAMKDYLDWMRSPAGQKVVLDLGYVPVHDMESGTTASDTAENSNEPTAVPAHGGNGSATDLIH